MKKEEAIELLTKSTDDDFVVRTSSEEQTFLANFKEAEVEKAIKPIIGDIHSRYEADFEAIVGAKKPEGVKGYTWIKEEAAKLKGSANKLSQAEVKLAELEDQLKEGKVDEAAKQKIDDLKKEVKRLEGNFSTAKAEWEKGIESERTKFRETQIKSELNHAMVGFKFLPKEIIDDQVREPFVNKVLNDLIGISYFDDSGKLVFKDTEGNIMRNKDSAVVTPNELLQSKLKPILDNGKQQPGLGNEKDGKTKSTVQTTIDIPLTVDTPVKLTAYLRKNYPDLAPHSKEYQDAFVKYSTAMQ